MSIMTRIGEERRAAIVEFIRDFWALYGHGPSLREIARGLGFHGPSGVEYQVQILLAEGAVTRKRGVARSLRVVTE
jgi:repressor LexA